MDAVKFIEEKQRMCDFCSGCIECSLSCLNNGEKEPCDIYIKNHPKKAVERVERWSKEHPQKTIRDDFKEKYPKAKLLNRYPMICPRFLGYKLSCDNRVCNSTMCCQMWDTPLKQAQQQEPYEEE